MKKSLKKALALLITLSVVLSAFPAVFAAESSFVSSHVVFNTLTEAVKDEEGNPTGETQDYVRAEAFIRNYTSASKNAAVYCAVYDGDNKLINATEAAGVNSVVRTPWAKIEEGYTAKAFVWEKDNQKIISNVAVFGAESFVNPGLDITFDGKSFSEYIGEEFSWDKESYTKALTAQNYTLSYPVVTAELTGRTDNTASVKVVNDFENAETKTTKIIVEIGERTSTERPTELQGTSGKVYSRPVTKTFTITYTEPADVITNDDVQADSKDWNPQFDLEYKATKTYNETNTPKTKIEFTFSVSSSNRSTIFIIKPKDETNGKSAVVDKDGNPLKFAEESKYYTTGNGIKGKMDSNGAMLDGAAHPVFPATMNSDNKYVTGTLAASNRDATAVKSGVHIHKVPEAFCGYNYIVLPNATTSGTLSFYVNQAVDVIAFTTKAITMDGVTATKTTECPRMRWHDKSLKTLFRAYLTANGIITDADVKQSGTSYHLTWDAMENRVFPHMTEKFGVTYREVIFKDGTAATDTYENYLSKWVFNYDNSNNKIIKNLTLGAEFAAYNVPSQISVKESIFGNNSSLVLYNGEEMGWANVEEPKRGAVISYPEVMEIEGTEFIALNHGIVNGYDKNDYYKTYGEYVLYTFDAGCDAELIFVGSRQCDWLTADGWSYLEAGPSEGLICAYPNGTSTRGIWYTKKVSKGDKITIKTVGGLPVLFARPVK